MQAPNPHSPTHTRAGSCGGPVVRSVLLREPQRALAVSLSALALQAFSSSLSLRDVPHADVARRAQWWAAAGSEEFEHVSLERLLLQAGAHGIDLR